AAQKFANLEGKARWIHLETAPPQCRPAEGGVKHDLITQPRSMILFDFAGKGEWLQTGEMIQIGAAWRLIDGPTPGQGSELIGGEGNASATGSTLDKESQQLLDQLRQLDERAPASEPGPNP